jgi:hypothetical protein
MRTDDSFRRAYRELERRMKAQAEADGNVFLPNLEPRGPVDYVLICMEPGLGRWARTTDQARLKVESGFRNFIFSIEDFIVHFCVRQYLCSADQLYHITDWSKGAMLVKHAGSARSERYERWYALLQEELELVSSADTRFVAVGRVVFEHLKKRRFPEAFALVLHYSGQAARARKACTEGREASFESFKASVSLADLVATAEDVLLEAGVPTEIRDETLTRLTKSQLSESRRQLIFHYKTVFQSLRCSPPRAAKARL